MHSELTDATLYRGMFGTMMVYLGLLVLSMTRYGLVMVANRRNHDANRHWSMLALQGTTLVGGERLPRARRLAAQSQRPHHGNRADDHRRAVGVRHDADLFPLHLCTPASPSAYIGEHLKAMVATGIAAYTAFLSVGLIEMFPNHAFNPVIWAIPSIIGMAIIIHFLRKQPGRRKAVSSTAPASH